jgi:hypothetical protein
MTIKKSWGPSPESPSQNLNDISTLDPKSQGNEPSLPAENEGVSIYKDYAEPIFNNGYQPIPIQPGTKAPTKPGWSKESGIIPVQQHILQHPDWGIGISNVNSIDADIADQQISAAVEAQIASIYPGFPKRVGQAPRFLVPISKQSEISGSSTTWYDPALCIEGGTTDQNKPAKNQIEFLKAGSRQFVAYATHPGTGLPYVWFNCSPLDTHADSLRVWTSSEIQSLYTAFDQMCEQRGFIKGNAQTTIPDTWSPAELLLIQNIPQHLLDAGPGDNPILCGQPDIDIAQLTKLVYALPVDQYLNTSYETWYRVGMAIHSATKGSEEGFELFDKWSSQGATYEGRDGTLNSTWTKWCSFQLREGGLGLGSIYHWLQVSGVEIPRDEADPTGEPAVDEPMGTGPVMYMAVAVKRFMYLEVTNEIGDFETHTVIPYGNKKRSLSKHDGLIPGRATTFLDTWCKHSESLVGQREWFRPVKDTPIVYDNGLAYFNSYSPPTIPKVVYDPAVIQPMLNHIRFIIPERILFEALLDWVAHKWRCPYEKAFAFLIITSSHQTGKGVVLALLKRIFGFNRVVPAPPSTFTDKASPFNEFLDGSIFNFCDEAKFDAAAYDTLKAWVYEPYLHINKKNGFKGTAETFSNWLIFSNHLNSAVIGPEDMRLAVSIMRDLRKPSTYYAELFRLINDPSQTLVSHFVAMLQARDISKFKRHEPPWSEAKAAMVTSSKNDITYLIDSMIADEAGPCKYDITSANLVLFYIETHEDGPKTSRREVSEILERVTATYHLDKYHVVVPPRDTQSGPLVNSKRQKGLLCLRNYDRWISADNAQLKLEYLRSREAAATPGMSKEEINAMQFKELKEA